MSPIRVDKLWSKLIVRFSNESVALPDDIKQKVDTYWQELLASGKNYKRGEVFTVTDKKETESSTEVLVEKTDYAHYLYSQNVGGVGDFGVRIIHTAALVVSSDNYAIFGEMGSQTSRAGVFQCCGGGIDNNDLKGDKFDFDHNITCELFEELGIDVTDVGRVLEFAAAYLKEGGPTDKMTVVYRVCLSETGKEFLEKYGKFEEALRQKGELPEFGKIIMLPLEKGAFNQFFQENGERCDEYMQPLFEKVLE